MRTWQKTTLGLVAVVVLVIAVIGGTGAYFALRHLEKRVAGEADAGKEMDEIRRRYAPRVPLVEVIDPARGDIRINRDPAPPAAPVRTVHIVNWKSDSGELIRTEVPLWLTRFSSVNVLSQLGVAPARFRLTVADIEHYGPGILTDYRAPGTFRILIWVD